MHLHCHLPLHYMVKQLLSGFNCMSNPIYFLPPSFTRLLVRLTPPTPVATQHPPRQRVAGVLSRHRGEPCPPHQRGPRHWGVPLAWTSADLPLDVLCTQVVTQSSWPPVSQPRSHDKSHDIMHMVSLSLPCRTSCFSWYSDISNRIKPFFCMAGEKIKINRTSKGAHRVTTPTFSSL